MVTKRYICALMTATLVLFFPSCTAFRSAVDFTTESLDSSLPGNTENTSVQDMPQTDRPVVNLPEDSAPPEEKKVVSFVGAGDNIVYYGNVRDAASCAVDGGRKYNFAPVYDSVKDKIQSADIAFINQETIQKIQKSLEGFHFYIFFLLKEINLFTSICHTDIFHQPGIITPLGSTLGYRGSTCKNKRIIAAGFIA